jgi:hypothetical protein
LKLLLDQNLPFRLLEQLEKTFPGSAQVRLIGMAEPVTKQSGGMQKAMALR